MEETFLITVVTLCYRSTHLSETVACMLGQTYPRVQYILADDGSEDFSIANWETIVREGNRGNIEELVILHNEKNLGTVVNYNNALRKAKGKYIFPLSGDDVYADAHTLENWTAAFEKTTDQVMCAYCDNYDETLRCFIGRWPRIDQAQLLLTRDWQKVYRAMEGQKLLPGATMARTKESLASLGFFDESYRLLEDYPFMMRLLRNGTPIAFWNKVAVKRRAGGVSGGAVQSPQLSKDMALFYETEVFPFAKDVDKLKGRLLENEETAKRQRCFEQEWKDATPYKKLMLAVKAPKFALRKAYHTLLKI